MTRRRILVGNWKMNGRRADLREVDAMADAADRAAGTVDVVACPPLTLLALAADRLQGRAMKLGAQTVRAASDGAFTGDVNAAMLHDAGANYCIVGHSERRRDYHESDAEVASRARASIESGLYAIICVGETLEQRQSGQAEAVVTAQVLGSVPGERLESVIVAYEPVWAIGTGLTPTQDEISAMHSAIRAQLTERYGENGAAVRLLYGGSAKPSNAREIFAANDVDGALVGGACLKASDFNAILEALEAAR